MTKIHLVRVKTPSDRLLRMMFHRPPSVRLADKVMHFLYEHYADYLEDRRPPVIPWLAFGLAAMAHDYACWRQMLPQIEWRKR